MPAQPITLGQWYSLDEEPRDCEPPVTGGVPAVSVQLKDIAMRLTAGLKASQSQT